MNKRHMAAAVGAAVLTMGTAVAQFTMPDAEAMQVLIRQPEQIGEMIATATQEQVAMLIIQAIVLMQSEGMEVAVIQNAVAVMFQKTAEVHGAQFGAAVVSLVRKKVNPRLLPIIRTGSSPPPPPGPSPRYPKQ